MKRNSIKFLFLFMFLCLVVFSINNGCDIYAASPYNIYNARKLAQEYTESDTLHDSNVTVQDYANSLDKYYGYKPEHEDLYTAKIGVDDSIVKIIPRDYFYLRGAHYYGGKEYGFYIYTFTDLKYNCGFDVYADNCSIVFVYDIDFRGGYSNSSDAYFYITPLFSASYYTLTRLTGESIVVPNDANDYGKDAFGNLFRTNSFNMVNIENIDYVFSLDNSLTLDTNSSNYDPDGDYGLFIEESGYAFYDDKLEVNETNDREWLFNFSKVLKFGKKIPYVGNVIAVAGKIGEIVGEGGKKYEIVDDSVSIETKFYIDKDKQIKEYGSLVKAAGGHVYDKNGNDLILNGKKHEVIEFGVNFNNNGLSLPTTASLNYSFEINFDTRYYFYNLSHTPYEFIQGTISGTSSREIYNGKEIKDADTDSFSYAFDEKTYCIEVSNEGLYNLTIITNEFDFSILKYKKNIETIKTARIYKLIDDQKPELISKTGRNVYLESGTKYLVKFDIEKIFNIFKSYNFMLTVSSLTDIKVNINGKNENVFNFLPEESGQYLFETTGKIDTYIEIYDGTSKINYDDDDGVGLNAKLEIDLDQNKIYQIKVRGYGSNNVGISELKGYYVANTFNSATDFEIIFDDDTKEYKIKYTATKNEYVSFSSESDLDTKFIDIYTTSDNAYNYYDDVEGIVTDDWDYNAQLNITLNKGESISFTIKEWYDANGTIDFSIWTYSYE